MESSVSVGFLLIGIFAQATNCFLPTGADWCYTVNEQNFTYCERGCCGVGGSGLDSFRKTQWCCAEGELTQYAIVGIVVLIVLAFFFLLLCIFLYKTFKQYRAKAKAARRIVTLQPQAREKVSGGSKRRFSLMPYATNEFPIGDPLAVIQSHPIKAGPAATV